MSRYAVLYNNGAESNLSNIINKLEKNLAVFESNKAAVEHLERTIFISVSNKNDLNDSAIRCNKEMSVYIAFSGRIDNRAELFRNLSVNPNLSRKEYSDTRLVLDYFLKYSENCFKSLLGTFSFVIYQPKHKTLFAVVDQLGNKTLAYSKIGQSVVIATDEHSIIASGLVDKQIDKKSVSRFFFNTPGFTEQTNFNNIFKIKPGHYLTITPEKISTHCYWTFPVIPEYRKLQKPEAAELFFHKLTQSVNSRIADADKVAILLSGGMDSTSIFSSMMSDTTNRSKVLAVSHVFDQYPSCDESTLINDMCNFHGIESRQVRVDDCLPLMNDPDSLHLRINDIHISPMIWQRRKSHQAILNSGCQIVMTGDFGDHLFSAYQYWLRDIVYGDFPVEYKWSVLKERFRSRKSAFYKENALRRLLPFNGITGTMNKKLPQWAARDLVSSQMSFADIKNINLSKAEQDRHQSCISQSASTWYGYFANQAEHQGLNSLNPFRDRQLLEFVLNLPTYLLYDHQSGLLKYIMREAMSGKMPDSIRLRKSYTVYDDLAIPAMNDSHLQIIKDILLRPNRQWNEYFDEQYVTSLIGQIRPREMDMDIIWKCLSYELWLDKVKHVAT